jgi:hypothetical protein
VSHDKPARVLPFVQKPRRRPTPPTRAEFTRSFLDAPAGLRIDLTVTTPIEKDHGPDPARVRDTPTD